MQWKSELLNEIKIPPHMQSHIHQGLVPYLGDPASQSMIQAWRQWRLMKDQQNSTVISCYIDISLFTTECNFLSSGIHQTNSDASYCLRQRNRQCWNSECKSLTILRHLDEENAESNFFVQIFFHQLGWIYITQCIIQPCNH